MTKWTDKAWHRRVSHERKVFNESLLKLMDILEVRLSKCQQILLDIQERILKARGPLVKAGEKRGARFGEPWLKWASDGIARLKRFTTRLERFMKK